MQANKRAVNEEDAQEDNLLAFELRRLRRQLEVMRRHGRLYTEESYDRLRRQRTVIKNLTSERHEIEKILKLVKCDRYVQMDNNDTIKLLGYLEKLDEYKVRCKKEKLAIKDLEKQLQSSKKILIEEHKMSSNCSGSELEKNVTHRLHVTENRVDQTMIQFSSQLAINAKLREEIDHLCREKAAFDHSNQNLTRQLKAIQHEMRVNIEEASHAFDERDEAQNEMLILKERNVKDKVQQEIEMNKLLRIIRHDDKLKEFMGIKSHERMDLHEQESMKEAENAAGNKEIDYENELIHDLQEAFDKIRKATGGKSISNIVDNFINKENKNFALYNYVNELHDTIDNIQKEIITLESDVKCFEEENAKTEKNKRKLIKEMEITAENLGREADDMETKNTVIIKSIDEIRVNVTKVFDEAHCDSTSIVDMLGSEEGVTNNNMLQYMGVIEHRAMELIKLYQYMEMLKAHFTQERKNSRAHHAQCVPHKRQDPGKVQVAIVEPHTIEDQTEETEIHARPFTRNELKGMVLKTMGTKRVESEMPEKKNTTKSPS